MQPIGDSIAVEQVRYPGTVAEVVEHELVVKKSRFIARLVPVASVAEADGVIAARRKQMWDARHHCTALRVGPHGEQQRSNDDGEPGGTAGVPMLEVLRRRDVTDVVVVVTRYFGGVKLGAGGLVRAYSGAVAEALDLARPVRRVPAVQVSVQVPHTDAGRLEGVLRSWTAAHDAQLVDVRYTATVHLALLVPPALLGAFDAALAEASGGALAAERGATVVMSAEVPGHA